MNLASIIIIHHAADPTSSSAATLKIGYNTISLFMHEVALHTQVTANPHDGGGGGSGNNNNISDAFNTGIAGPNPLSAAQISAISSCLTAVDGIFNTFLPMDVERVRCLPIFNFVRVVYGMVILVKMYFAASRPGSELGRVIDGANLRVDYYLDALVNKFRHIMTRDGHRPAGKFLLILVMLRSWFVNHESKGSTPRPAAAPRRDNVHLHPNPHPHAPPPPPAPTPHAPPPPPHPPSAAQQPSAPPHLLSEAAAAAAGTTSGGPTTPTAANNSSSNGDPNAAAYYNGTGRPHQTQPQHFVGAVDGSSPWPPASSATVAPGASQAPPTMLPPLPWDMTFAPDMGLDMSGFDISMETLEGDTRIMMDYPWIAGLIQDMPESDGTFPS